MTGRIVREGHTCPKPSHTSHGDGTVWQCDCGRYWHLTGATWVGISSLELGFLRLNDSWSASQKAGAAKVVREVKR